MNAFLQSGTGASAAMNAAVEVSRSVPAYEVSVRSVRPPELTKRIVFDFGGYLPLGDGCSLPIHARPPLLLDLARQEVEVEGWGVRTQITNCAEIPRQMSRVFLRLWHGSQSGTLEREDQETWARIADQVDYQAFCADRSLPRWVEGVLIRRNPHAVRVRWTDGTVEELAGDRAGALALVDGGEVFRALVRYGRDGHVRALSDVVPLGREEDLVNQLLSDSWTETVATAS